MADEAVRVHLIVSPYTLCAAEPAALVGLLVAHQAVTYLPRSLDEAPLSRETVLASPRFQQVMHAIQWATPAFNEGLLATSLDGLDPTDDFAIAREQIATDPELAPLRRFAEDRFGHDPGRALERLGRDLTRSGPDPSISVPLAAALDRFADRFGYTVVRSDGPSLTQRAERAIEEPLVACSIPALVQCSGERLMETRRRLEPQIEAFATTLQSCLDGQASESDVRSAASVFADAFDAHRHHIERPEEDPDDPQVLTAEVAIRGVAHTADHAMLASTLAATRVTPRATPHAKDHPPTARSIVVSVIGR